MVSSRIVGTKHLKTVGSTRCESGDRLNLQACCRGDSVQQSAHRQRIPRRLRLAYRMDINHFRGRLFAVIGGLCGASVKFL